MTQTISINFIVPQSWNDMSDKHLRYVYQLIASDFAIDEVKTLFLLKWSGAKVIDHQDSGAYLMKFGKTLFEVTPLTLAELLTNLGWLDAIPASPVRLKKLRNHASVDAEFQGVPFETYIVVEGVSKIDAPSFHNLLF